MSELREQPEIVESPPEDHFSQDELTKIEVKAKEYRIKGSSDEEAERLAQEEVKGERTKQQAENEELWKEFTKKIDLSTLLEDQMIRALKGYKKMFNKTYPDQTIDFKLKLSNLGGVGGKGLIAGAQLKLEYAINGNWKTFRNKEVKFSHVSQIRDHMWKVNLYEAMLHDVFCWGLTYSIQLNRYNDEQQSTNS